MISVLFFPYQSGPVIPHIYPPDPQEEEAGRPVHQHEMKEEEEGDGRGLEGGLAGLAGGREEQLPRHPPAYRPHTRVFL